MRKELRMAAKKRKQQKKPTKASASRAGAAPTKVETSAPSPDPADAFSYPEGTLSVLSVDGVDKEFRLAPGLREAIADAVDAIKTMLRQGYTFLAADRDGAHARVQRFDERRHAY